MRQGDAAVVGAGERVDAAQRRVEVGAEAVDRELEQVDPEVELDVAEPGRDGPRLGPRAPA